MKSTRSRLLAAAAAVALIAGTGAAHAQTDKPGAQSTDKPGAQSTGKPGAQSTGKVEAQGQTGGANAKGQGGARNEAQTREGSTQEQTQGGAKAGGDRDAMQRPGQAQQPAQDRQQSGERRGGPDSAQQAGEDKPAQLNEQQRSRISTTVREQKNLRRVERTSINFNINVGALVPRTVNLEPLPAPFLAVVPAYRGYLYVVVGDDLLIIHPRTYEIVAIVPA